MKKTIILTVLLLTAIAAFGQSFEIYNVTEINDSKIVTKQTWVYTEPGIVTVVTWIWMYNNGNLIHQQSHSTNTNMTLEVFLATKATMVGEK